MKDLSAKMKTFINQLESGEIKNKQIKVLRYIQENPTTDLQDCKTDINTMKNKLAMTHQSLTASLSLLEDCGLVKVVGQIQVKSSHYSVFSFVDTNSERQKLMKNRFFEKYKLWVASGIRNFKDVLPSEVLFHLTTIEI